MNMLSKKNAPRQASPLGVLSLADKIKKQVETKLKVGLYELELLEQLPIKKLEILENLVQEQEFKIPLNSLNSNERALNIFAEKQEFMIEQLTQKIDTQMSAMNKKIDKIADRLWSQYIKFNSFNFQILK